MSLALSLHMSSPLVYNAYAMLVMFPRLILRPLLNGCHGIACHGIFAAVTLRRQCNLWKEGKIDVLVKERTTPKRTESQMCCRQEQLHPRASHKRQERQSWQAVVTWEGRTNVPSSMGWRRTPRSHQLF